MTKHMAFAIYIKDNEKAINRALAVYEGSTITESMTPFEISL